MREERAHISLGWFVVLACVIHIFFSLIVIRPEETEESWLAKQEEKKREKEIEITDPKLLEERQVVETSRLKEQDPELLKNKARFYSEETSRAKEERQSPLHGRFQQGERFSRNAEGEQGSELPLGEEGEQAGKSSGKGQPALKDLMLYSRTPNRLPDDIREGSETVLNTDKVVYASFINRIAEQIYDPWYANLEMATRELRFKDVKLETNVYVTKLQVTMDKMGEILGVQILKSSGYMELDEAPKKAFWSLEGFRNPPSQLLRDDGYIRLTYEFHLDYRNSGFSIIPGRL